MMIIVRCCRYIKDLGSIDNEDEDIDIQEGSTKIKPKIIKILSTTVCGLKNDMWPRNMLLLKNQQFLANFFETWSK